MPRVYLTLEQELFKRIEEDANKNNITINLLMQNIFERIYMSGLNYSDIVEKIGLDTVGFDYTAALNELIKETNERDDGEFTLVMLDSFSKLCISTVEKGYLQPSTLRAKLGKLYNSVVKKDQNKAEQDKVLPGVERARDDNGDLKFISRTAVYVKNSIKQKENELQE
ncbi:hypothetical protein RhiirA1_477805 [Rhizophagus irregularis]|uniref:Uncharacterized protein n=2 Tax=cellular organisms TaxID=131567 RepID=A0A2N0QT14_9GLOM|nr:hypothetical protein [Ureibacillus massiliensis]KGR90594.1 hypothetical protein CD30_11040 [Ureibacillus massiliensis 4400831 = CIP 108448 = CCUG 49529]PKC54186.1 hypothetical protein RhiirA1_477805 [Rhizophagus irregularis]